MLFSPPITSCGHLWVWTLPSFTSVPTARKISSLSSTLWSQKDLAAHRMSFSLLAFCTLTLSLVHLHFGCEISGGGRIVRYRQWRASSEVATEKQRRFDTWFSGRKDISGLWSATYRHLSPFQNKYIKRTGGGSSNRGLHGKWPLKLW